MRVGFVGWRGMVGSVLMQRMQQEDDFQKLGLIPTFCSTSNSGGEGPVINGETTRLADAYDLQLLSTLDAVVSCQGGEYTTKVYGALREQGWQGYWIDAASTLRLDDTAALILDPVNKDEIDRALKTGIKTFVGPNCSVSLMLMAVAGLFREGLVEWVSSMTYQAASGAGAANMKELVAQNTYLNKVLETSDLGDQMTALELEEQIRAHLKDRGLPKEAFGHPLAYNLLPFIDKQVDDGYSREEWKGMVETNKILGTTTPIPVDGLCVRVGALRCHSQGLTIKLKRDLPLEEIEQLIAGAHEWVRFVPNTRETSLRDLTPAAVSGKLEIAIGRVRKMKLGEGYITAFTVGDQLLWGAAEPLRRMLKILVEGGH